MMGTTASLQPGSIVVFLVAASGCRSAKRNCLGGSRCCSLSSSVHGSDPAVAIQFQRDACPVLRSGGCSGWGILCNDVLAAGWREFFPIPRVCGGEPDPLYLLFEPTRSFLLFVMAGVELPPGLQFPSIDLKEMFHQTVVVVSCDGRSSFSCFLLWRLLQHLEVSRRARENRKKEREWREGEIIIYWFFILNFYSYIISNFIYVFFG